MDKKWLIYGANGYTGRLIVAEAAKRGLQPVLAGRNETAIKAMADEAELEFRCFDLHSRQEIAKQLEDIHLVLHCAGPFSETASPMMAACLYSKTHYLDITGEISVFEHAHKLHVSACKEQVVLCPGVGFDVVPTDCLASALSERVPDATSLWLAFSSRSGFSPGTAKTSVEGLASGGRVRRNGRIINVPLAYKVRQIDYGSGPLTSTTIPWGDVATAYYSTGIANIDVYIPVSERKVKQMRRLEKLRWLLQWKWLVNYLKKRIDGKVKGPTAEQLEQLETQVWGEVINKNGDVVSATMTTANGYKLTVLASLAIIEHLLEHEVEAGYTTPSQLMGHEFVLGLEGTSEINWQDSRIREEH